MEERTMEITINYLCAALRHREDMKKCALRGG